MKKIAKVLGILGIITAGVFAQGNKAAAASGDVKINSTNFPDAVFRKYVQGFDQDKNGILSLAERKKVTKIESRDYALTSLKGIEYFTELTDLDCVTDVLEYADVSKNTKLKLLDLGSASMPEMDFRNNTKLECLTLRCWREGNGISKIDLSKNTKLWYVDVTSYNLKSVNLSNNKALTRVDFRAPLQSIDVSMLPELKELYIDSGILKSLDISKNKNIDDLRISSNKIESLNLDNNTKLDYLEIHSTSLKKFSLQKLSLGGLHLEDVPIESLDLSKHIGLRNLYIKNTPIKKLKINSDCMYYAYVRGTKITELDLSGCKVLREVYNKAEDTVNGRYDYEGKELNIPASAKVINNIVVTAVSNEKGRGTVTGGGAYSTGERVVIRAKANTSAGYAFSSLNYGTYRISDRYNVGDVITTNSTYSFIAKEDVTIVANFVEMMPFTVRIAYEHAVLKYGGFIPVAKAYSSSVDLPEIYYQWYREDKKIKGATKASYVPQKEDIGKILSCEVTTSLGGKTRIYVNKAIEKADGVMIESKLSVKTPEWDGAYGVISGVDSTMEYSTTKDFAKKKTCPNSKLKVKAGTYYIRYAETDVRKAGEIKTVKVPKGPSAADEYTDLDKNAWYMEAINYVYVKGIMNGISGNTFSPMGVSNRAEFVTMLYNLAGKPKTTKKSPFKDVSKGSWYEDAVNWAYASKISNGVSKTEFGPGQVITRQQAAVMLYQYAVYKKLDVTGDKKALNNFPDKNKAESWAKTALEWAVHQGVINGKLEGQKKYLAPTAKITRAECAQMIKNMVERVKSQK